MSRSKPSRQASPDLAIPTPLTPAGLRALRRRLPGCIEDATASLNLARDLTAVDPEGALVHLLNVAGDALRARAAVVRGRTGSTSLEAVALPRARREERLEPSLHRAIEQLEHAAVLARQSRRPRDAAAHIVAILEDLAPELHVLADAVGARERVRRRR